MESKKGIQLNQAFGAVLAIMLIGLLVIVAIFLFVTMGNSFPDSSATPKLNEVTSANATGTYLVNSTACGVGNFIITRAVNTTDGLVIPAANYTVASNGLLTNGTRIEYDDLTINYTYTSKGSACIATQSMVTNFSTYPALVGLVGVIVFLGIVIGVLVASFLFGGKREV